MKCKEYVFAQNGINTRISGISEGILRITRTKDREFLNTDSPAVVLKGNAEGDLTVHEKESLFTVGNLTVRVGADSGAMTFMDAEGRILLQEPKQRCCLMEEKPVWLNRFDGKGQVREERSIDGVRAYVMPAETYQDRTAYECRQQFVFAEEEGLYGLGSHEEGWGNLRDRSQVLYQHNMKAVVPVLVSTKGWGILFDMGCMMAFHDDEEGSYLWADCADELNWYFFYGDGSYLSLMQQYRRLTGAAPMLPKYALGYIQSKERYVDAKEMLQVAEEYRRRQVPLDMLVLDWQSWPEGQWGWKCFDKKRFPDAAAFIASLHQMNVKMMISIWPSMQGEKNQDRQEMLEHDCMLGNRLIYNAFSEEGRKLYWKQAEEGLFRYGVDAWWCDCTEPFESDWHGCIKPEPIMRAICNTEEAKRYLDPAKISLYSLYHSQGIYNGQRSVTQEKRVCNLTRSSWAGQHRYGTVTWSGDVSATWETLRRQIPEGLNFCAAGEPYWSTDIGAFFTSNTELWFIDGDYDDGVQDLGYRELYVRWAQYAAFLPLMRSHGTITPREIWQFGEKGDVFYDAIEAAIHLRYHLIPYLYSLMAQTYTDGISMLRVPALIFTKDQQLQKLDDQMMLGDWLMVKPVTKPMYYLSGSEKITMINEEVSFYLPAGHQWFDLYTGEVFEGGQFVSVHAPLHRIPAFVRSGAILPWGDTVQSTEELKGAPLELIIYPGEDGEFTLYDDAGDGYGYEANQWARIPLHWNEKSHMLTVEARQGEYEGMDKELVLKIHLVGQSAKDIVYTGKRVEISL